MPGPIRRHGVGTLINKGVVNVDLDYKLNQTLKMNGKHPGTALVRSCGERASDEMAARLGIETGDRVLRVSRMIKADGKPAIFCIDYIAEKLVWAEAIGRRI